MNTIAISGSPRTRSNTDYLLRLILDQTGGEFIKLSDHDIRPCSSCWACLKTGRCAIIDDMSTAIVPRLLAADVVVLGSPVYFNNVTAQVKCFMDRTWAIRKKLRNKIGVAVVVGRKYGAEGAIAAIHAFFLKHEMIVASRGICGTAFGAGEIQQDVESVGEASKLGKRLIELGDMLRAGRQSAPRSPGPA